MKRHVYNCLTHILKSIAAPIIVLEKVLWEVSLEKRTKTFFQKSNHNTLKWPKSKIMTTLWKGISPEPEWVIAYCCWK